MSTAIIGFSGLAIFWTGAHMNDWPLVLLGAADIAIAVVSIMLTQ